MFGLLSTIAILTVGYAVYLWNRYQYWSRKGIASPPIVHWWLGNVQQLQKDKKSVDNLYNLSVELKTDTYGLYEGGHRTLVTSDLDILNDVFIKKFENFHGRKLPLFVAIDQDTDMTNADILGSQGLRWKRLRTIMNPSFTTSKLRHIEPIIKDSVEHLINLLKTKAGKEVEVMTPLNRLTMDVIYRIAFGRGESILYGEEPEEIVNITRRYFDSPKVEEHWIRIFFTATYDFLPVTRHLFKILSKLVKDPYQSLKEELEKEVKKRMKMIENGEECPNDFIQMFLESQADDEEEEQFTADLGQELERTHVKVHRRMTANEIVAQCTIFLLAGYDTTANSLGFFLYEMAMNPDIQEKLYEEIISVFPTKEDVSAEAAKDVPYLEFCVKENLRKNPHVGLICARKCTKTCTLTNGLVIGKNDDVRANVKAIHYDKKLWGEDVEKFIPERFEPEEMKDKHPLSFFAFGTGPRMCIGMRLALLEERVTIIRLLQEFKFERTPNTKMEEKGLIITQPHQVLLNIIPR